MKCSECKKTLEVKGICLISWYNSDQIVLIYDCLNENCGEYKQTKFINNNEEDN